MTTTRYLIEAGGIFKKEITTTHLVQVNDDLFNKLAAKASIQIRNIARAPNGGIVHLSTRENDYFWTVEMPSIRIKAPFNKLDTDNEKDEGVLTPYFVADGGGTEMTLDWTPPNTMKLRCLVMTQHDTVNYWWTNIWFFATDEAKRVWKLPMPNTYDDCSMCHGQKTGMYHSHLEAVGAILEALQASPWNADLWKSKEKTEAMFRFKLNDKGAVVVPPRTNNFWTLCVSVAPAIYDHMIL